MTTDGARALFTLSDVRVLLGGAEILRGVDLVVPAHGITAIVGASGSGKSTLTRLTNRLLDPTSGTVRMHDQEVLSMDVLALRRTVGMVFQRPILFSGTVRDNLAESGVVDAERHEAAMRSVGLEPVMLEQDAATVSGGEAQRICLARALLIRPKALVADEPTSALDQDATLMLERLARDLANDGVPILWVTHDLAQVDRIADHHVRMEAGRVVER